MSTQLRGVLAAFATPFTPAGQIDESAPRLLVDRSIDGGVDGVLACGSTGEFAAMSGAERRLVVETVVDQAANRVPVVAQTGAVSTAEAVELSRHPEAAGAAVPMVVAPYYEALSLEETMEFLKTVAAAVDVPIMLYNLPAATGVDLDPDTVGQLAREVDNIRDKGHQCGHGAGGPTHSPPRRRHLDLRRVGQPSARRDRRGCGRRDGRYRQCHAFSTRFGPPRSDGRRPRPGHTRVGTALPAHGCHHDGALLDAVTAATISRLATDLPQFSASA